MTGRIWRENWCLSQYRVLGNSMQCIFSDQRGTGLLPEEVGAHVNITICEKSHSEATVAIAADKRQEVLIFCHAVLAVANNCKRFVF
jgi:hypothetical protein